MESRETGRPMVSVAMIAYNKADVIAEAIRGVVKQRVPFDIELVIVDDASADSTYDVASEWAARYPGVIKLYRNAANKGLQANYIEAFSLCTGKYLAICDADDYWFYSRKLAVQVAYMEAHPDCAITFHRVVNYYEADGSMSLSNGRQLRDCGIAELSRSNFITNLSVVYRKDLVDLTKLPSWLLDDRSPDYAMHMLYARHGAIHYFRRPMGVYRIGASGAWSLTERYKRLEMSLSVREHLIDTFADVPVAVSGLEASVADILLAMVSAAGDDKAKRSYALGKLRERFPDFDEARIGRALQGDAVVHKPLVKRFLTSVRRQVSRLLPRPC